MSEKNRILPIVATTVALSAMGILFSLNNIQNNSKKYLSIMGIECDAIAYDQRAGIGYLTLTNGEKEFLAKVNDVDLQNNLSTAKLENIIGANIGISVPDNILKEMQINIENADDVNYYFYSGALDDYFVLVDISYR